MREWLTTQDKLVGADLIHIDNVGKTFHVGGEDVVAVKSMTLSFPSEIPKIITVAGESGSGKSTLAAMVLGFDAPTSGQILCDGKDIRNLSRSGFSDFRRKVQGVFQNPFETFNPFYKVGHALTLTARNLGKETNNANVRQKIVDVLDRVRLDPAVLDRYSHELSGGQLQRLSLARAVLANPRLIVADEPVSMIDASLRLQVLRQLVDLKSNLGISILYITHDLSTALQISDELLIAYKGEIVERGNPEKVIEDPQHPYTKLLMSAVPVPDPDYRWSSEGIKIS